jgi:hypothetical protein
MDKPRLARFLLFLKMSVERLSIRVLLFDLLSHGTNLFYDWVLFHVKPLSTAQMLSGVRRQDNGGNAG